MNASSITELSKDELHRAALRAAKRALNAEFEYEKAISGTKIAYHILKTPFGPRSFSIVARNYKSESRYPIGFRPELFSHVDEFAIYLNGESVMYLIPQRILVREVYGRIKNPSINEAGQWFCNLRCASHELESNGLWPRADIRPFAVAIAPGEIVC
jgi:hypothetical protein